MSGVMAFIDGSIYANSVLDHAAWAAERTGLPIEIVHVLGRRDVSSAPVSLSGSLEAGAHLTLLNELVEHDAETARLAEERGRMILDQAKARLLAQGPMAVATLLRDGDIVDAVQALEERAEMIVIGKRGEAADFATLHLGSSLERVARVSTRPVLVASRGYKPIHRFMIAFDGGASVMKAIQHIVDSPLFAGLPCDVVTVGQDDAATRGRLDAAVTTLARAGYAAEGRILPGAPEQAIAAHVEANAIDMLVMGAYGHSRIRNLIIGSTTTEMVRSCKIPIVLYR